MAMQPLARFCRQSRHAKACASLGLNQMPGMCFDCFPPVQRTEYNFQNFLEVLTASLFHSQADAHTPASEPTAT